MIDFQPLTLNEVLSLSISLLGFLVLIISIVYLIRQTRQMTHQTELVLNSLRSGVFEASAQSMFAADQMFIANPDLRPFFYAGADIRPGDKEYDKVAAAAEYMLDFFGYMLIEIKTFPLLYPEERWTNYMEDTFASSPILLAFLAEHKSWFDPELVAIADVVAARVSAARGTPIS